jgi:hypothetical protein
MLDPDSDTDWLYGEASTLHDLRVEECNHCAWCNGCICADEEAAKHCCGYCECFDVAGDDRAAD